MKIPFSGASEETQRLVDAFNARVEKCETALRVAQSELQSKIENPESATFAQIQKACVSHMSKLFQLRQTAVSLAMEREELFEVLLPELHEQAEAANKKQNDEFERVRRSLLDLGVGQGEFSAQEQQRSVQANHSVPVREARAQL